MFHGTLVRRNKKNGEEKERKKPRDRANKTGHVDPITTQYRDLQIRNGRIRTHERASSGLNLVSDCSRLFLVRRNAVHKSHVSPIRVGPHFHLHLYQDAGRGATAGGIESTVKSRPAPQPNAYQAPNSERELHCCSPRARAHAGVCRWKLGTWHCRLRACTRNPRALNV